MTRLTRNVARQFRLDGVFEKGMDGAGIGTRALLPLLETVFYEHKDATLISYGPKGSGTSLPIPTPYLL